MAGPAAHKVLIVGGGIGGLSAAVAMRGASLEVDIVEINPDWSVYGVGIIQPGNAIRALDALGLGEKVVAAGFPMEGSRFHDAAGNTLADLTFDRVAGERYPPHNGITRTRLHQILTEAVKEVGADVRLGVTVASLDQGDDGVEVDFSDGGSGRYDLVVGADGINSLVRELAFDPGLRPEPTGQVVWRYNVRRPPEVDGLWMFAGTDGKAGAVPLAPDLMYVLLVEEPPDGQTKVPNERLAAVMRERLAEFGGVIADAREEIVDNDGVVLRPVQSIFVPAPWHRGAVVLIGDAAHATSPHVGQGAAMAIEDAVVLAEEVASGDDLEPALDAFEARRYDRCRTVHEISMQIGTWELERNHEADFAGLTMQSTELTAEPI
jgi:2-polyprenyl-6-methoxyphenol hydroxylase-like FAD-dependent oxidoreductase